MPSHILFRTDQGRAVKVDFARIYLIAAVGSLFLFSGILDPDFEAYRLIYESAGGWIAAQARDPFFLLVIKKFAPNFEYEFFRYIVCAVFGFGLFRLAQNIENARVEGFGFLQALFLTPFILLKLHVQIREGAALLLWLIAITGQDGDPVLQRGNWKFWLIAAISSLIHLSVVVWWAATFLFLFKRPDYRTKVILVIILFSLYGVAMTRIGREFITERIVGSYAFFRDTGYDVQISAFKAMYWSLFLFIPVLAFVSLNRSAFFLNTRLAWRPSLLGLVGAYGTIGFFSPVLLSACLWGAAEGDLVSALRIANTHIILLLMHLSLTRPQHPLTWAVFVFSLSDAGRLILL